MSGSLEAKVVTVDFRKSEATGRIYASSKDIRGLSIGRHTIEELEAVLPGAIEEMYAACGERVVVSKVQGNSESHDINSRSWVAFPAEVAREALARRASLEPA